VIAGLVVCHCVVDNGFRIRLAFDASIPVVTVPYNHWLFSAFGLRWHDVSPQQIGLIFNSCWANDIFGCAYYPVASLNVVGGFRKWFW